MAGEHGVATIHALDGVGSQGLLRTPVRHQDAIQAGDDVDVLGYNPHVMGYHHQGQVQLVLQQVYLLAEILCSG